MTAAHLAIKVLHAQLLATGGVGAEFVKGTEKVAVRPELDRQAGLTSGGFQFLADPVFTGFDDDQTLRLELFDAPKQFQPKGLGVVAIVQAAVNDTAAGLCHALLVVAHGAQEKGDARFVGPDVSRFLGYFGHPNRVFTGLESVVNRRIVVELVAQDDDEIPHIRSDVYIGWPALIFFAMLEGMQKRLRWGILSTSKFARTKVIPALLRAETLEVAAIASRDEAAARTHADAFGIPKAYGSYEELLADGDIDVVYNPLPNHLHVPWSIRAAEAGKHVLCEKPLGLHAEEVDALIAARDAAGVVIGEAFMVATHPQWLWTRDAVAAGKIGQIRAIQCCFSYNNTDPANIRNQAGMGGGGIMDIGCYPIFTSRFVLGRDPVRVCGQVENDPAFGVDRLASAMLDYGDVQCQFLCSTQMNPYQKMHFHGTRGRIEIEIPFNAPPDKETQVFLDTGSGPVAERFPICDQYTIEGEAFSAAVRGERPVPVSLETAKGNMRVIDAVFQSARENRWVSL
jgi:predicted dehydrogenase